MASHSAGHNRHRDETHFNSKVSSGVYKDATGRSLDIRAAVPALTRPPPPGTLRLRFRRGILSLCDFNAKNSQKTHSPGYALSWEGF